MIYNRLSNIIILQVLSCYEIEYDKLIVEMKIIFQKSALGTQEVRITKVSNIHEMLNKNKKKKYSWNVNPSINYQKGRRLAGKSRGLVYKVSPATYVREYDTGGGGYLSLMNLRYFIRRNEEEI